MAMTVYLKSYGLRTGTAGLPMIRAYFTWKAVK